MIYSDFLDDDALKRYTQALNSRAKAVGLAQTLSVTLLRDCIYSSGGQCAWCTVSLVGQAFEVDHIISLSTGGGHSTENLAVSCPDCNRRKAAKHPARFAQETVAQTGVITPLIQRILNHYKVEARIQRGLFDADADPAPKSESSDTPASEEPPPYIWK